MGHEPRNHFRFIQTYRTSGDPIDAKLRRAYRAQRGRRSFPILRALTTWLLQNGRKR